MICIISPAGHDDLQRVLKVVGGDAHKLDLFLIKDDELGVRFAELVERPLQARVGPGAAVFENEAEDRHENDEAEIAGCGYDRFPPGRVGGGQVDATQATPDDEAGG